MTGTSPVKVVLPGVFDVQAMCESRSHKGDGNPACFSLPLVGRAGVAVPARLAEKAG